MEEDIEEMAFWSESKLKGMGFQVFPGSPQLNNIIAGRYFNTTPYAAPIMGIVAGLIMLGCGYLYLYWKQEKLVKAGERFVEPSNNVKEDTGGSTISINDVEDLKIGKAPKSKRKQKSEKNTISLDI